MEAEFIRLSTIRRTAHVYHETNLNYHCKCHLKLGLHPKRMKMIFVMMCCSFMSNCFFLCTVLRHDFDGFGGTTGRVVFVTHPDGSNPLTNLLFQSTKVVRGSQFGQQLTQVLIGLTTDLVSNSRGRQFAQIFGLVNGFSSFLEALKECIHLQEKLTLLPKPHSPGYL